MILRVFYGNLKAQIMLRATSGADVTLLRPCYASVTAETRMVARVTAFPTCARMHLLIYFLQIFIEIKMNNFSIYPKNSRNSVTAILIIYLSRNRSVT